MKEKYRDIVAFVELEELIDTPIKQYSSGMLARLGFAIDTEIDSDILLVDENWQWATSPFSTSAWSG